MTQYPSIIPGSTVNDRFALIRPLGKGSMGSVWLARHLALDIDVALKFIDSSLTKQVNYVERFRREARAAAQIKSSHVVQVLDYGTDQHGRPFMAMEFLDGVTLGSFLNDYPRLGSETAARIITHAARGLGKAHALGVVHRDIKPENLFLVGESDDESFILKILDFGVAKAGISKSGYGTLAGQLVGSPAYMSPEQARGYKSIDHRSDLFSLGVVAYQCLTGKHPFHGEGLGELLLTICSAEHRPPTELVEGLPKAIDAWFDKALAKKAHDRFPSARDMSLSFTDALGLLNVSSGVDVTSSLSRDPAETTAEFPTSEMRSGIKRNETQATQVTMPVIPRGAAQSSTSSRIQPLSIAEALTPLMSVPHTLGVALLDHNGECLLMRGEERDPATFSAMATHATTISETVESIDGAEHPTHLSVRFEKAAVYVRFIGPFTLVVLGDAELRALLLTVGSNKLSDRLETFMEQLGGVEPVANLLRESGVGLPLRTSDFSIDLSPRGALEQARSSETLHCEEKAAGYQQEQGTGIQDEPPEEVELPMRSFWGFGTRSERKRTLIAKTESRNSDERRPPPPPSARKTMAEGRSTKPRVQVYRGKVVGGPTPAEPEKAKKKVRVYRGRVIDEK